MNFITGQEKVHIDQFESIIAMMKQAKTEDMAIIGFEWDIGYGLTWQLKREYLWELSYRDITELTGNYVETLTFVVSDDYYKNKIEVNL